MAFVAIYFTSTHETSLSCAFVIHMYMYKKLHYALHEFISFVVVVVLVVVVRRCNYDTFCNPSCIRTQDIGVLCLQAI